MENKLVSIIVSVYNGERYIEECIESVLNQDYKNIELILVDDGSFDSSNVILDKYSLKDKRVKVIHKENSGVSNSRNIALERSLGEYICFLDQDDILAKDYVSYFYGLICKYNVEISATPSPRKFFNETPHTIYEKDHVDILSGEETAINMLYHKIVIAPWNKMISRNLIERNKIRFQPNFFNGEGFAFSVESFLNANRVAMGYKHLYYYRVGDPNSGASRFKEEWINSSINAQQYIKSIFANPSSALLRAWAFSNWHTHCDALNVIVCCGAETEYQDLYGRIKRICQEEALCAFSAPVSLQQKLRGLMFKISPYIASRIINYFRIRKFVKLNENKYKSDESSNSLHAAN